MLVSGAGETSRGSILFGERYMETDEHQQMFFDEAKSWVKILDEMGTEKILSTWNYDWVKKILEMPVV
jgi:hypothetical protein